MKAVGYIRVSTEEQAREGVSLAAQEAKLRAYADLYDIELVAVVVDAGQSAKSLKRPGLRQALSMLSAGEAEGLLIAKLDRLTRSVRDLGTLLDEHFRTRHTLLSVADQIDTRSAAGRLMLNLLTSVAEWERETIGERTRTALQYLKTQGRQLGGPRYDENLVRRVREMAVRGMSQRRIAATLNEEQVPTLRGGPWVQSTVAKMLARL